MRMKMFAAFAAAAVLTVSALAMGPVPRPAPNLDFVDANGKHVVLSSYRGKVVVLQFLLTTCPHCQNMSMMLSKMQAEFGPRGFQALGVAYNVMDEPTTTPAQAGAAARDYASKYAAGFPVGYDPHEPILAFLSDSVLDRLGFPQVVVVDKKGVIRAQSEPQGTAALQDEHTLTMLVDNLLKEGAISKK
ncbi:MAG TPA: TlpA disulfide reductase family protein [Bryobacteraceae bacterium]